MSNFNLNYFKILIKLRKTKKNINFVVELLDKKKTHTIHLRNVSSDKNNNTFLYHKFPNFQILKIKYIKKSFHFPLPSSPFYFLKF